MKNPDNEQGYRNPAYIYVGIEPLYFYFIGLAIWLSDNVFFLKLYST